MGGGGRGEGGGVGRGDGRKAGDQAGAGVDLLLGRGEGIEEGRRGRQKLMYVAVLFHHSGLIQTPEELNWPTLIFKRWKLNRQYALQPDKEFKFYLFCVLLLFLVIYATQVIMLYRYIVLIQHLSIQHRRLLHTCTWTLRRFTFYSQLQLLQHSLMGLF